MIGLILSIISTCSNVIGLLLLKKGVDNFESKERFLNFRAYFTLFFSRFKDKYWFTGGLLYIIGYLLRFFAISFSDLSFVRLIYVSHLIFVVIGSRVLLKEKVNKSLLISITITLSGLIFISIGPELTRNENVDFNLFVIYNSIFLILACVLFTLSLVNKRTQNIFTGFSGACLYAIGILSQGYFSITYLGIEINLRNLFDLLQIPFLYFMMVFSIAGFFLQQVMSYKIKISIFYSVSYILSELVTLFGSIIIFGDNFSIIESPFRVIGAMLILSGFFMVISTQKKFISIKIQGEMEEPSEPSKKMIAK